MTTGQCAWQATSELVEPTSSRANPSAPREARTIRPAARELVPSSLMPLTGTAA